jgi:hypothetical protein
MDNTRLVVTPSIWSCDLLAHRSSEILGVAIPAILGKAIGEVSELRIRIGVKP